MGRRTPREQGLRSTLECFGIRFGSKTKFCCRGAGDFRPRSGDIRVPGHNGIGNRNRVRKLREDNVKQVKRALYIQSDKKCMTDPLGELGGFKQASPIPQPGRSLRPSKDLGMVPVALNRPQSVRLWLWFCLLKIRDRHPIMQ